MEGTGKNCDITKFMWEYSWICNFSCNISNLQGIYINSGKLQFYSRMNNVEASDKESVKKICDIVIWS